MKTSTLFKAAALSLLVLATSLQVMANAPIKQTLDPNGSKITWLGAKVTGTHDGSIKVKEGFVEWDKTEPKAAQITIDMNSMDNFDLKSSPEYQKKLMDHLKNDDFFATDKFPTAKLQATSFKKVKDGEYQVKGDLTIKDQTHPVEFTALIKKEGAITKASGKITVDRTLYGIKYGSGKFFQNLGDKMIKDTFELTFDVAAK